MGDWSMTIILSMCSMPSMASWAPGCLWEPCSSLDIALWRISSTRVDLPDPDTPVTEMKMPRGKSTSMRLRLCSLAPRTVMTLPLPFLRSSGTGMDMRPVM